MAEMMMMMNQKQTEEEKRKMIDMQRVRYQEQLLKRLLKEASEKGKTPLFYQANLAVKSQRALQLREVQKERDAQVTFKQRLQRADKDANKNLEKEKRAAMMKSVAVHREFKRKEKEQKDKKAKQDIQDALQANKEADGLSTEKLQLKAKKIRDDERIMQEFCALRQKQEKTPQRTPQQQALAEDLKVLIKDKELVRARQSQERKREGEKIQRLQELDQWKQRMESERQARLKSWMHAPLEHLASRDLMRATEAQKQEAKEEQRKPFLSQQQNTIKLRKDREEELFREAQVCRTRFMNKLTVTQHDQTVSKEQRFSKAASGWAAKQAQQQQEEEKRAAMMKSVAVDIEFKRKEKEQKDKKAKQDIQDALQAKKEANRLFTEKLEQAAKEIRDEERIMQEFRALRQKQEKTLPRKLEGQALAEDLQEQIKDKELVRARQKREIKREGEEIQHLQELHQREQRMESERQARLKKSWMHTQLEHLASRDLMKATKAQKQEQDARDALQAMKEADRLFTEEQQLKAKKIRDDEKRLQDFQASQIAEKHARHQQLRREELECQVRNAELIAEEEDRFQKYSQHMQNLLPLYKAARRGIGGGHCSVCGGLQPSYMVQDPSGCELPRLVTCTTENTKKLREAADIQEAKERLGFMWR